MSRNITILMVGAMLSLAIFFGLRGKEGGVSPPSPEVAKKDNPEVLGVAKEVSVSIDDDAVLGDKEKAKVAIVEFSDYECSFCKRFVDTTLGQIVENYIDTEKAILVFRDLPLPFHDPASSREAMAAECARDQGGDKKYFEFHDQIFENSPGNGTGLAVADLGKLADKIGLSGTELVSCVEDNKFKKEVAADVADAASVGINGTPGFVVGKLTEDGEVTGVVISGAQPYAVFEAAVEKML